MNQQYKEISRLVNKFAHNVPTSLIQIPILIVRKQKRSRKINFNKREWWILKDIWGILKRV